MARTHYVKKARKDVPNSDIKKGESYYWWKFRFGSKHTSRTPPKQSQLTQSEFLGTIYDIEDRISGLDYDDLESEIPDIISELENLREECEEKRGNMPEQLQDSGSGEMLQNRSDSVQEMIDELEGIDIDIDIDEEDIRNDIKENAEKENDETQEDFKERINEETDEEIENKKQEVLDEVQGITYNGE